MQLTQETADTLIKIEKVLLNPINVYIPQEPRQTEKYPLGYKGLNNTFNINDLNVEMFRGSRNPKKVSYKLLYKGIFNLIRLDMYGTRHMNPDGKIFEPDTPHLHIYDEIYKDKWAYSVPPEFSNTEDIVQTFKDFLSYSNVINVDEIKIVHQGGVFDDQQFWFCKWVL